MNKKYVFELAHQHTPDVQIITLDGWLRHQVATQLSGSENIGIELGVARGVFSRRMLDSEKFIHFFGVDVYGDIHNTEEYANALKHIGFKNPKYCLLRMDFESALEMFDDNYFDFIYVDGFAHTGEEGGKTFIEWYKKLKIGGIIAGDDYHEDWPLVVWGVNDFAVQLDVPVHVTTGVEDEDYCKYPTWYIRKLSDATELSINPLLYQTGMKEKKRVHRRRVGTHINYRRLIGNILQILGLKEFARNIARKVFQ